MATNWPEGKKIYFLSDFHLGIPDLKGSLEREKKIVRFLDEAMKDAAEIFLVGDLFDFWFEYKKVIPKGFIRLQGKMAEIADSDIKLHVFTGNHDMWMFGYYEQELDIPVYKEPIIREWNGKKFYIAHGDGLGPGDKGYKFLKKIFSNKVCQVLFGLIPPYFGMKLATYLSTENKLISGEEDAKFLGEDKEWLVIHSKEIEAKEHFDYYVYGHRHLPMDITIGQNSRYISLGDWIKYFTYAVFDGEKLELKTYEG